MAINNYKHNLNEPLVVKDLEINGRVTSVGIITFTKSIQLNSDNSSGGGLILSDDGDFVDLNNGFGSFRFSNGIQIYNASRSGSPGITLASGGDINLLFSGTNINFSDSGTTTRGILGQSGNNDFWFFGGGGTGSNAGFAQISTGDDGTEPIHVRQYIGDPRSGTLQRTLTLLNESGNTSFPGSVGIGTTNPAETLHVLSSSGRGRFQNSSNTFSVLIDPFSNGPRVSFGSNGDNSFMEFGAYNNINNLDTKSRDLRIFSTSAPNAFILQQSTGNIGIGTANAFSGQAGAVGLDVNRAGALIFARNVGTSNESAVWAADENFYSLPSYKGVGFIKKGTAAAGNVFGSIPNADLGLIAFQNTTNALIYTNGSTPLIFGTLSAERMRIDGATGNVGVSTSIARDTFQVGVGVTISSNGNATYTGIVTATGGIDVVGQAQLRRVAITTTSTNINMIAGRTYPYYSSITLTLPASPTAGDKVEIINRSKTSTAVVARNGNNIMGLAEDMTIDLPDVGFTLIYTVASDGWVIGK